MTYRSGFSVSYGLVEGRATTVILQEATGSRELATQLRYQPSGAVGSWLWRYGATKKLHQRQFDTWGRITRYPAGTLTRDLTYDGAGRVSAYSHGDAAGVAASV